MAMSGEACLASIRDARAQHLNERKIFLWHGVTDGVGNVDCRRAGIDGSLDAAAKEIALGSGGILCRPFDVIGIAARTGNLVDHHLVDLVRLFLQLKFHMHGGRRDECVNPLAPGWLDCFGAAVDIFERSTRETANDSFLRSLGY